jgi:hypothetical protein
MRGLVKDLFKEIEDADKFSKPHNRDYNMHLENRQDSQQIKTNDYINTVGAKIMTHTRIMACGTSGDDLMHLKTSHIKSRVIL